MQNRIYVDDKLVNVCYNEYALMCNVVSLREEYGDRVTVRSLKEHTVDEEYQTWLDSL